jgi:hypothetical protein
VCPMKSEGYGLSYVLSSLLFKSDTDIVPKLLMLNKKDVPVLTLYMFCVYTECIQYY